MKISELIIKLEAVKSKEGDIDVTIHCDQETSPDGKSEDVISTILWKQKPKPKRLMLCDTYTFQNLVNP